MNEQKKRQLNNKQKQIKNKIAKIVNPTQLFSHPLPTTIFIKTSSIINIFVFFLTSLEKQQKVQYTDNL